MKKIYYLFILVFITSCSTEKVDKAVITGTIENPVSEYVIFSAYEQFNDTAFLDSENRFTIEIPLDKPVRKVTFNHGEEYAPLYLEPGYILTLKFNTEEFDESLTYEGEGSAENSYLISLFLHDEKDSVSEYDMYQLELDQFKDILNSYYTTRKESWEKYSAGKESTFWDHQLAALLYHRANLLTNYPDFYEMIMKTDTVELGENYYDYMDELDLNNPDYLVISEYELFLRNYVRGKTSDIWEVKYKTDSTLKFSLLNLNTILEVIIDEKVRNHLLMKVFEPKISYSSLEDIQEEIDFYFENCTDEVMKTKARELISSYEKLAKGQPAPVFNGKDLEGNVISLTDFRGKYVYVDVWATWCGPCKYEIPHLKELEADYHDKNVVFISCSIDDDAEAWRKMVTEDELKGVQILTEGAWESTIIKEYMINGIPNFMLIDREGKIISRSTLRPSGNIREILDALEGI